MADPLKQDRGPVGHESGAPLKQDWGLDGFTRLVVLGPPSHQGHGHGRLFMTGVSLISSWCWAGEVVGIAGDVISPQDFIETFIRITGKRVRQSKGTRELSRYLSVLIAKHHQI
jgi:hypothetical protein